MLSFKIQFYENYLFENSLKLNTKSVIPFSNYRLKYFRKVCLYGIFILQAVPNEFHMNKFSIFLDSRKTNWSFRHNWVFVNNNFLPKEVSVFLISLFSSGQWLRRRNLLDKASVTTIHTGSKPRRGVLDFSRNNLSFGN